MTVIEICRNCASKKVHVIGKRSEAPTRVWIDECEKCAFDRKPSTVDTNLFKAVMTGPIQK